MDGDVRYCICRSNDGSGFMICCTQCEEWFHGHCVNITHKESKDIKDYFCDSCRQRDNTLLTLMKTKKKRTDKSKKKKRTTLPFADGSVHCFGPSCQKVARPFSKFCSDKCGFQLAINRIYQFAPSRIQQQMPFQESMANLKSQRDLNKNRSKQQIVMATLEALSKQTEEMDKLVSHIKQLPVDKSLPAELEDDSMIFCVSCGFQIRTQTAIRHMEQCFNKLENQTLIVGVFKFWQKSPFCDIFNQTNGTFCKRLRSLCSEHLKEPKITDEEVCGSPQITNYCQAAKKSCLKHWNWEKLRRAELELEMVKQLTKLDELTMQEEAIKRAMKSRNGLLGLLLHTTIDHEKITPAKK